MKPFFARIMTIGVTNHKPLEIPCRTATKHPSGSPHGCLHNTNYVKAVISFLKGLAHNFRYATTLSF